MALRMALLPGRLILGYLARSRNLTLDGPTRVGPEADDAGASFEVASLLLETGDGSLKRTRSRKAT